MLAGRTEGKTGFHSTRIKFYPGSSEPCEIMFCDDPIFNPSRLELADDWDIVIPSQRSQDDDDSPAPAMERKGGSVQGWHRAQTRAYDLIRCNPSLDMFLTLTFSPDAVDRSDWGDIIGRLNTWLDNRVRRNGLLYILCPELHHDGEAIHLHGLANESALKLDAAINPHTGRKLKRKGKQVYNISDFPFGYTTALRVTGDDASQACAGYIFKYMRKQGMQRVGGRYYLSGGKLAKPEYVYCDLDYYSVDAPEFALKGTSSVCKVLKGDALKAFLARDSAPVSAAAQPI